MNFSEPRPTAVFDTEVYLNFWSIAFRDTASTRIKRFTKFNDSALDIQAIALIFKKWRLVSFNGINYDMPMVALAIGGATNGELKRASDEIIMSGIRSWQFMDKYGLSLPQFIDHIDLMEVSPGSPTKPSLKIYAGRLHFQRMQDLPIEVDATLTPADVRDLNDYHDNDLEVTLDLYLELKPQIDLRSQMTDQYDVDLRSKSDAQVAEAVIKNEIERSTGKKIYRPDIKPGTFQYTPPKYIEFQTEPMREMLRQIIDLRFLVFDDGIVEMPKWLEKFDVRLGDGVYRMGIGGLHSSESGAYHVSDDESILLDRDVTSYYPWIILSNKFAPKHLGQAFLKVYRSIYERRIAAKKRGDAGTAETLKIVLNGSFGKFGSPYSILYSPDLMIQTTITGQLAVLMLIEELEMRDLHVVSANTDGIVTKVPHARRDEFNAVVTEWEWTTTFTTEETEYAALYSRDVNNYISLTTSGSVKRKGAFTVAGPGQKGASGMKKNPQTEICVDAVVALLKDGTPIEQTIKDCYDIRKFVSVTRVTGGAEKDGEYIGKAIRWYYADDVSGPITRKMNGNTVPRSIGAMPCLDLPAEFPDNVDYDWYVREAHAILQDFGLPVVDPALVGRTGVILAHLDGQKTVHAVAASTNTAACGRQPPSMRDPWVEVAVLPAGMKACGKCAKAAGL